MTAPATNHSLVGCLALVASVLLAGCGDSAPDEPSTVNPTSTATSSSGGGQRLVASVDSRPNINGIPLDVYGDLVAAASGPNPPGPGPPPPDPNPEPPEPEPETGGAIVWSDWISAEAIEGEMKAIRNKLAARLTSLGSYNSSYLEMRFSCATMALLAHIATQHDGEVGWKEKGKFIRVLAGDMVAVIDSSQARGRGGFTKTNEAFLKICDLLDGNDPPELPEAKDEADFAEFAELGFLMKRAEIAAAWLSTNVGSEDNFKEKVELAQRETSLLMLLAVVFNLEDYGYGPASVDPEFSGYSDRMRDAAKAAFSAAKGGNFTEFDLQRSNVGQACAQCHMVFKNG
jgi:hypothetical protein